MRRVLFTQGGLYIVPTTIDLVFVFIFIQTLNVITEYIFQFM